MSLKSFVAVTCDKNADYSIEAHCRRINRFSTFSLSLECQLGRTSAQPSSTVGSISFDFYVLRMDYLGLLWVSGRSTPNLRWPAFGHCGRSLSLIFSAFTDSFIFDSEQSNFKGPQL